METLSELSQFFEAPPWLLGALSEALTHGQTMQECVSLCFSEHPPAFCNPVGPDLPASSSCLASRLSKKDWGQLEAMRCLLAKAGRGLSIEQLCMALSWFGFQIDPTTLLKEVRRYVHQVRLQLYRGTVTLPDTPPSFTLRVAEKEPTPGLAGIQAAVREKYAALVDKEFTNVEIMEFVLSHAPQGPWADEFLAVARSLGIDFKEWCIHSVVGKEARACHPSLTAAAPSMTFIFPRPRWPTREGIQNS